MPVIMVLRKLRSKSRQNLLAAFYRLFFCIMDAVIFIADTYKE